MIVLSNNENQVLAPGESIIFDKVIMKGGCCECHMNRTDSVRLKMGRKYLVTFSGNISNESGTGAIELIMTLGGVPLEESSMRLTPGITQVFDNVSATTGVEVHCMDFGRISITNNSATANVGIAAGSSLVIREV